jgi:hypothetical protein
MKTVALAIILVSSTVPMQAEHLGALNIHVRSGSPEVAESIKAILAVRGPKDPNEKWTVDLFEGDIRIIRKHPDYQLPPGVAVEFWTRGPQGRWIQRKTA